MKPPIREIVQACKQTLMMHYGSRLKGVVLFGSALGRMEPESDIDLLVLLEPPFDYFRELRRIVDLLYPVQLQADHLISAKPVDVEDFERGTLLLYRTAKREGLQV